MPKKVVKLKTWASCAERNLRSLGVQIYQNKETGPVVGNDRFCLYRYQDHFVVQDVNTWEAEYFDNIKGAIVEALIKFGLSKNEK